MTWKENLILILYSYIYFQNGPDKTSYGMAAIIHRSKMLTELYNNKNIYESDLFTALIYIEKAYLDHTRWYKIYFAYKWFDWIEAIGR